MPLSFTSVALGSVVFSIRIQLFTKHRKIIALTSVVDSDPEPNRIRTYWIHIQECCGSGSIFGIRIRIQERKIEEEKTEKSKETDRNSNFIFKK